MLSRSVSRCHAGLLAPAILLGTVAVTGICQAQVVIDFQDLPLSTPQSYFNGNPGNLVPGQSVTQPWTAGGVVFANTFGIDSYGGFTYPYWSGFSYSNVVDTTTNSFENQYASYPGGGFGGSSIYAVAYSDAASLTLPQATTVAGFQIANTTYAALTMINGDGYGFTNPLPPGGWFKVTATGKLGSVVTGTADYYLADLRGSSPPGILATWDWFNLSSLGTVDRVDFAFDGSDVGSFGLNTPAYFAMDNLTVAAVPEPGSTALLVPPGTLLLWWACRRRHPARRT
jgi:hypothetical protein